MNLLDQFSQNYQRDAVVGGDIGVSPNQEI